MQAILPTKVYSSPTGSPKGQSGRIASAQSNGILPVFRGKRDALQFSGAFPFSSTCIIDEIPDPKLRKPAQKLEGRMLSALKTGIFKRQPNILGFNKAKRQLFALLEKKGYLPFTDRIAFFLPDRDFLQDKSLPEVDFSRLAFRNFRGRMLRLNLKGCDLRKGNLRGAELPLADFEGATLQEAVFWGANLKRSLFKNADLAGANFEGADLQEADFREAKNLQKVSFQRAENLSFALFPVED